MNTKDSHQKQTVQLDQDAENKNAEYKTLAQFFTYIGTDVKQNFKKLIGCTHKPLKKSSKAVKHHSSKLGAKIQTLGHNFWIGFSKPFHSMKAFAKTFDETQGFSAKSIALLKYIGHVFKSSRGGFFTVVNHVVPVVAVVGFIFFINGFTKVDYAIAVKHEGSVIGYIDHETTFDQAQALIQQQIIYVDGEQEFDVQPEFALAEVDESTPVISESQLADKLISCSSEDISSATGLYVDGKFYGATTDRASIDATLETMLEQYKEQTGSEEVAFVSDVTVKDGLYLNSSVVETEALVGTVTAEVEGEKIYKVEKGDSLTYIANKVGMKYNELRALNPDIDELNLQIDEQVLVSNSKPFLSVKSTKQDVSDEAVPYEKVSQEDPTLDKGTKQISQEGEEGVKTVTSTLELLDGIEVSRTVIDTVVVKEPVAEITLVGTKEKVVVPPKKTKPTTPASSENGAVLPGSSGNGSLGGINFIRPLAGGQISCGFGGGHNAIDWRAPYGTNIYAAASGRVILAKTYSSYGKCVIIDHGNGVQTLYAHQSSINVQPGQTVSQGQVIGLVGSTGNSTGNHLHFELSVNGSKKNPLNYVGG